MADGTAKSARRNDSPHHDSVLLNLRDYEREAASRLPKASLDFIAAGAGDEETVRANAAAFSRIKLLPRMLTGVTAPDMAVEVLGQRVEFPVLLGPAGLQKLAHPEGELASARAAQKAGTIMALSAAASYSIEDVAAAAEGPQWFQVHLYRDRSLTEDLVRRAEAAGYCALCLVVDVPRLGKRDADARNRFRLPPDVFQANFVDRSTVPDQAARREASRLAMDFDAGATWDDFEWLGSLTNLPVVVKGILTVDDARTAVQRGARGIVVSNHGGRQLDGTPATAAVLPAIADAVGQETEVMVDGGIQRGTDVLKALALGAKAVLIGKPIFWGLAVDGEDGVSSVLSILRDELELTAVLAGCKSMKDVPRDLVWTSLTGKRM